MKASVLIKDLIDESSLPGLTEDARERLLAYFEHIRAVPFGDQWVFGSALPPFPSRTFDRLMENLVKAEDGRQRPSMVGMAITNRCMLNCWHCYNAGRRRDDLPFGTLRRLAEELLDLGTVMVVLTGGEPLLRDDLEQICSFFEDRCCLTLATTGLGLTPSRAKRLKAAGLFALGVSLDSDQSQEHDQLRGRDGLFDEALRAVGTAREAGLFPYIRTVIRPELIPPERFMRLLDQAGKAGALEVILLEPVCVGNLASRGGIRLSRADRGRLLEYQQEVANHGELPLLTTTTYLGSSAGFGCTAGLGHLYIDGSGEVCPCNMIPFSFGNVKEMSVRAAVERMHEHFRRPRTECLARILAPHVPEGELPTAPNISSALCRKHLAGSHDVPGLYRSISGHKGQQEAAALRLNPSLEKEHVSMR